MGSRKGGMIPFCGWVSEMEPREWEGSGCLRRERNLDGRREILDWQNAIFGAFLGIPYYRCLTPKRLFLSGVSEGLDGGKPRSRSLCSPTTRVLCLD